MYFLLYNTKITNVGNDATFCLFGRELLVSGEPNLSTAHLEKSRIRKLVVNMRDAYVPYLLICEEYGETENNAEDAVKEIKQKLKLNEFEENSLEVLKYKNIFHEDLYENITAIKVMKKIGFNYQSNYTRIKKKIKQFNNYEEFFLISKKIKGPCLLKIDYNEDFILYNQFKSVNLEQSNTITVLGKVDLPKINYSSLTIKHHNNIVEGYSLCINGNKFICGAKDNSIELKTIKNGNNIFKTYSQEQKIIKDIQYYLDSEQVDSLVVYNLPHAILNKFDFVRFLFCDLYAYSLGNLKCRDYSIEDLRDYYNCKANSYSFSFYFGDKFAKLSTESKLIHDIYIASDALLLAKEMAEISGCPMNKVLSNNRANIIDFALLNELYDRNYIFPSSERRSTQQYTGGMVLTPAIGAYTDAVLLLDFNSLYPSIVQEYNVCFSTIGNSNAEIQNITEEVMPLLENSSVSSEKGFLPIVISNLVNRRREVKKLITKNSNETNKIYDLRQKALKLLANSIYGCLGFPISRFCNYTMASFITRKGRNLLEEAKNIAINDLGLDVIYGDTDSIMINTKLNYCEENLDKIKKISEELKSRVNSKYKYIEIDLEKIFVRLFIYKKKKYAGLYAVENGTFKKEYKGIDTVRRDVCKATIDILNGVLDILLDDSKPLDFEESKKQIFSLLYREASKIKSRPVTDFIINMTLSKPLELYDKNAPLPHVCLAKRLTEKGIYIDQRDMISFVIGCTDNNEPIYKRAFLPSEVQKIDYEYYVTNQILSSLLKIVRIPNCIDISDLQRIFGVKTSAFNTQSISTHFVKFITACCNKLQDPSDQCISCNKDVPEEFYFEKVKKLINNEITNLYKSSPKCVECDQYFDNFTKNCKFCKSALVYKPENEEFNMFIDNLEKSFLKTNFEQVKKFIEMHIEHSSFKIFDLRPFFNEEIENYNEKNKTK